MRKTPKNTLSLWKKMGYEKLLKVAPAHDSSEFIVFLRDNNKVFWENDQWIVIENVKYHTKEKPWYTAFWKGLPMITQMKGDSAKVHDWYDDIDILWYEFGDYEWLKKAKSKQTIKRFHIHLIKDKPKIPPCRKHYFGVGTKEPCPKCGWSTEKKDA